MEWDHGSDVVTILHNDIASLANEAFTYVGNEELSDVKGFVVCRGISDDGKGVCLKGVPSALRPVHLTLVLFAGQMHINFIHVHTHDIFPSSLSRPQARTICDAQQHI